MNKNNFFIFFLFVVFFVVYQVQGAIPPGERAALIALYNATNGDNWNDNRGWKTPPLHTDGFAMPGTEEDWKGINLSGNHVNSIYLGYNNLEGKIPAALSELSLLRLLYLYSNKLTGSIPSEIGDLANLAVLRLNSNQLSGTIPPELGGLLELEYINLKENQLTGPIPPGLGNLVNLENLELQRNQLSGMIPPEFGNLNQLGWLDLSYNQLTGIIPPEFGNMSLLHHLNLSHNQLTGLPAEFTRLGNLSYCELDNNQLTGNIPPDLGNMTQLRSLHLHNNQFSGSIPVELGKLTLLYDLYLHNNRLTGNIPGEIVGLNADLQLEGNKLTGELPANITSHQGDIDIRYNGLHTQNPGIRIFLNEANRGWEDTQTIAPTNVSALAVSTSAVKVSWHPILYKEDTGGFQVYFRAASGGQWKYAGKTNNKSVLYFLVTGLSPGTGYFFKVNTITNPHANNMNAVISEDSDVVSATTDSTLLAKTISVRSLPAKGVNINVTPTDNNGQGNGITDFTRVYFKGTACTLTAPETFNGQRFFKWTVDGLDYTNRALEITVYDNHDISVVYGQANLQVTVTTVEDFVPGSLRDAITKANANNKDTTIYLPAGTYYLFGPDIEDNNRGGDLDINTGQHITIIGEGAKKTIIDGSKLDRVLQIKKGTVSISGVTFQNGLTRSGLTKENGGYGGGISNIGTLNLTDCDVINNRTGKGGSGSRYGGEAGNGGFGGGICNEGNLNLKRCTISNNSTGTGGWNCPYYSGEFYDGHGGSGGGIYNAGIQDLLNCTISNNVTGNGGSSGCDGDAGGDGGDGGGIFNTGKQTIQYCRVIDNVSGNGEYSEADFNDDSRGGHGGGIFNAGNSDIFSTVIARNISGAVYWSSHDSFGGNGGGIFNEGTLILANSTVTQNKTGFGKNRGNGGGIYNSQSLTISSSTLCFNSAEAKGEDENANDGPGGAGGGIYNAHGTIDIKNTIIALNKAAEPDRGMDYHGTLESSGYNLIKDTGNCIITGNTEGNITGVDPLMGPLADNGGPTETHALQETSPALDAGKSFGVSSDQRGYSRPVDIPGIPNVSDGSDIGAYEYQTSVTLTITSPTANTNWPGGTTQDITWSATGPFNSIDIEYTTNYISEEDSDWKVLVNGAPNTGRYSWHLPNITSDKCRLWMKGWGPQGDKVAWSKIFSITASANPTIILSSPNGGEEWEAGSTQYIKWSATGPVDNVKIEYSVNDGSSWLLITAKTPNDGLYSWIVPDLISSACRVKVTDVDNKNLFDVSDAPFTIVSSTEPPAISLNLTSLTFGAKVPGPSTGPQQVRINNSGGGNLDWTVTDNQTWLSCTPASGTGPGTFTARVEAGGLTAGTYTGTIVVSAANAVNSPQSVTATLNVYDATVSPFGSFDTPINGSTVYSSVPVTGWVLDDIGVDSVKIYRENGSSLVYIGEAVFVEGARPDIEAAYPGYPNNYRAGWGYMMLTNFFPNGGNGTFKLLAIAADKEGLQETLGTCTINIDNANAVKPFGALDTPAQGGIASGEKFIDSGWALTPQPNTIPFDGSTITVWVDGVPVGNPVYNKYRQDVADLFPGYNNSSGAWGYFYLDTTKYENGIHTIAWSVTDDAGNSDGIGNRYFTIQNIGNDNPGTQAKTQSLSYGTQEIQDEYSFPLTIRRLFPEKSREEVVYAGSNENFTIDIKETEAIMIEAPLNVEIGSAYLMVGKVKKTLPYGASVKNGKLYWTPMPGYVGLYEIRLILQDTATAAYNTNELAQYIAPPGRGDFKAVNIRVRISAKFSQ